MTDEELLKSIANIVNKSIGSHIEPIKTEQQIQGNEIKSIKTEQQTQGKEIKDIKAEQQTQGKEIKDIKAEQQTQGKEIKDIKAEQQTQGKTLKYMKTKINKIAKSVDIIGRTYDEDIVENTRRIDRIENHLDLPAFKAKH